MPREAVNSEEIIIPLGRGCIAVLYPDEVAQLLARDINLWERAVKRGKHHRRAEKNGTRQAKPGRRTNSGSSTLLEAGLPTYRRE